MKSEAEFRVPNHLKTYIVGQDYSKYTSRDHALWRFIMRNMKSFLASNAHSSFLHGLELTGVPTERIPRITEMNEKLSQFGWSAVCVRGFIPPLAFLDFQSSRILPIAADMRSLEHFDYTPAPDIVHEAAGHAPILADKDYREYLVNYANVARKAIFSDEDVALYEAIRLLSDVKENPDSSHESILAAEEAVKAAYEAITWVSEAAEISRMYWWTVEYGLIGDVKHPKLYGAGLLSSLGESRDCLEDKVKKIPFGVDCIKTSYDITEPQPQLFVAKDFKQLSEALREYEKGLAFIKGGAFALQMAKKACSVTTTVLDSGLELSGVLKEYILDRDEPIFIKFEGPVQLCFERQELEAQGIQRHQTGFSSPIGLWKGVTRVLKSLTDADLNAVGLKKNQVCELEYLSGFKVRGFLKDWTRSSRGDLLFLTWKDCVVARGKDIYYQPEWGDFDLAVGVKVISVFGGPSDWDRYGAGDFGQSTTQPGRTSPYTEKEKRLFSLYDGLRSLREQASGKTKKDLLSQSEKLGEEILKSYNKEWLLALELVELAHGCEIMNSPVLQKLEKEVLDFKRYPSAQSRFIKLGVDLAFERL